MCASNYLSRLFIACSQQQYILFLFFFQRKTSNSSKIVCENRNPNKKKKSFLTGFELDPKNRLAEDFLYVSLNYFVELGVFPLFNSKESQKKKKKRRRKKRHVGNSCSIIIPAYYLTKGRQRKREKYFVAKQDWVAACYLPRTNYIIVKVVFVLTS